jgi:hypothetical protein
MQGKDGGGYAVLEQAQQSSAGDVIAWHTMFHSSVCSTDDPPLFLK